MVSFPLAPARGARLLLAAHRHLARLRPARETAVHAAADAHLEPIKRVVLAAFDAARHAYRIGGVDAAFQAVRDHVHDALPPVLLAALAAGGDAALKRLLRGQRRAAGDVPGHEFHGNQWTEGGSITTTSFGGRLKGLDVPKREKNQVYLVRYSKADEMKDAGGLGGWSHAHADVNVGIDASSYYSKTKDRVDERGFVQHGQHEGFLYIGRADKREVIGKQASNRGKGAGGEREVLNALTTKNLDVVIDVRTGQKVYERRKETLSARSLAGPLTTRFDASDPVAAAWAREHAAELAKGISETTRRAIRDAVAEQQETGEDSEDAILAAVGDATRAELIARTESMAAANEGQREGWDQAVEAGLLDAGSRKVWIAAADPCPECEELDGEEVGLDEEYPNDGGDGPPLHPRCRCTEGITA